LLWGKRLIQAPKKPPDRYRNADAGCDVLKLFSVALEIHSACTHQTIAARPNRRVKYIALQEGRHMKSLVVKRSIVIAGHKTSVSLEEPFWLGLKEIAQGQHVTLSTMVGDIDTRRRQGNLSSAIRLFVLDSVRTRVPGFTGTRTAAEPVVLVPVQTHA
jgi:predicted DNA-binding ribbon-helix-helix protein